MSNDIKAPEDVDAAVSALPSHQHPYGAKCPLARDLQSVLFHYGVRQVEADMLVAENILSSKQIRYVNPDGNSEQVKGFKEIMAEKVKGTVNRIILKRVFQRMLASDPFAKVVPPPPSSSSSSSSSKSKGSSKGPADPAAKTAAAAASTASSSASSAVPAPAAEPPSVAPPKAKRRRRDDTSSDDSDHESGRGGKDSSSSSDSSSDDDDDVAVDSSSRSRCRDLASLFDAVDNEVRVVVNGCSFVCCLFLSFCPHTSCVTSIPTANQEIP